jgi:hypothetical protein
MSPSPPSLSGCARAHPRSWCSLGAADVGRPLLDVRSPQGEQTSRPRGRGPVSDQVGRSTYPASTRKFLGSNTPIVSSFLFLAGPPVRWIHAHPPITLYCREYPPAPRSIPWWNRAAGQDRSRPHCAERRLQPAGLLQGQVGVCQGRGELLRVLVDDGDSGPGEKCRDPFPLEPRAGRRRRAVHVDEVGASRL